MDSIETAIAWAKNMTWKGIKPMVKLVEKTYEKGIKASSEDLELAKEYWLASSELPSWDVTINPSG